MRNYFILDGVDSRDFGVYISGQGTFSAPQKAYQFYNIPGRNGALLGNEHRLENINVSYEAFIYADFDNNMAKFRSFLLSLNGYKRLTDSYHPDEYRMAVYVGPFEPKVQRTNDAGSFTITFSCKPQRWLLSGDTKYAWVPSGNPTVTGSELSVYAPLLDPSVVTWSFEAENSLYVQPIYSGSPPQIVGFNVPLLPTYPRPLSSGKRISVYVDGAQKYDLISNTCTKCEINLITGSGTEQAKVIPLPTTGWTMPAPSIFEVAISDVSHLRGCSHYSQAANSHLSYGQLQYAISYQNGYINVKDKRFGSANSFMSWLSSANVLIDVEFSSPALVMVSPTFSPDFSQDGFINVSTGDEWAKLTLAYLSDNQLMSNPTAFPSEPLIRAYGNGSFEMDGVTVTITNATTYTDIDCEAMDCYEGSTNRNNDVSFSTYDFPKLQPGDNAVEIISGITVLEITPRWWMV